MYVCMYVMLFGAVQHFHKRSEGTLFDDPPPPPPPPPKEYIKNFGRGLKIDIDIYMICEKRTLCVNPPPPPTYGLYARENVGNV